MKLKRKLGLQTGMQTVTWYPMLDSSHIGICHALSVQREMETVVNKEKLIQIVGALYRFISYTSFTCNNIFTVIYQFL